MLPGNTNVTCSSKPSPSLILLRGLVVESLCGDQSPSALWHQLRCELPRWHGPGTQASATRWLDIRHRASSETWSHHSHHSHHSVRSNCQIQLAAHWRNKNYSCHPHRSWWRLNKITLKKGKTLWLYNYLLTKPIWCQKNSSDQLTLKTHTAAQLGWKPSSAPGTSSCSTCNMESWYDNSGLI